LCCDRSETRTCCQEGCGLPIRDRTPNLLRSPIAGPILPVSPSPTPPTATRLRLPDRKTGQKKTKNSKEHNRQQQAPTQRSRLPLLKQPEPPLALVHQQQALTQRSHSPLLKQPEPPLALVHILRHIPIGPCGLHLLSPTTAIIYAFMMYLAIGFRYHAGQMVPERPSALWTICRRVIFSNVEPGLSKLRLHSADGPNANQRSFPLFTGWILGTGLTCFCPAIALFVSFPAAAKGQGSRPPLHSKYPTPASCTLSTCLFLELGTLTMRSYCHAYVPMQPGLNMSQPSASGMIERMIESVESPNRMSEMRWRITRKGHTEISQFCLGVPFLRVSDAVATTVLRRNPRSQRGSRSSTSGSV
jgi:hypothetical protein